MMLQRFIAKLAVGCLLVSVSFPIPSEGAIQATYYVDPANGKDNNPGTLSLPFKTITRARDIVRGINVKMTGDIIVYLRGGTYFVSSPIIFNSRDTGTAGHPITYCNYPGETPIISGSTQITGWTLYDASKNIYQAKNVSFNFRQLYVNGVKAIRARTPNPGNFFRTTGFDINGKNIQVENANVANWNNLTKVEMHLLTQWADNTLRISAISSNSQYATIKFQTPEEVIFRRAYPYLKNNQCYFFENAYEFIDTASEWYLNQSTKTLYYKARPGEDMSKASVIAPAVETLMKIQGDSLGSPVHHLSFQGIMFAHSTYLRPSDSGYAVLGGGQYCLNATNSLSDYYDEYVGRPPAGVYISCAKNLGFKQNIFTQMAATALDFCYGTNSDLIIGNVFHDIGGSAISVAKYSKDDRTSWLVPYNPVDAREICKNDSIVNNRIYNVTTEIMGACGIACGFPQAITIEHNEVSLCSYTGIQVGCGSISAKNAMSNNKIRFNHIYNVMQILCDGAGIYTMSNQPNSQISNNYLHDIYQSPWAEYGIASIFLDEETSGYTVCDNVRVNVPPIWYNGTYAFNTSFGNDGVDSNVIRNAGLEPAYSTIQAIPFIINGQPATTGSFDTPFSEIYKISEQFSIKNGYITTFKNYSSPIHFYLMNMAGQIVYQKTINGNTVIDLKNTGLAKGVYVAHANSLNCRFQPQKVSVF